MLELLDLSSAIIDGNDLSRLDQRNPTDARVHEIADGVAMVTGFSHILSFRTDDGLVLFDTSSVRTAERMRDSLRHWSTAPVDSVVYTHGHVDHVGGMQVFMQEADDAGRARPRVIGHENVLPRFDRYRMTQGYNAAINARQFRPGAAAPSDAMRVPVRTDLKTFGPRHWHPPQTAFRDRLALDVGGLEIRLRHDRGETDDHAWAWIPSKKAICAGDLVLWVFPNAGNPQKVQRYPAEWAAALRAMMALEPELLLPAHGLPVAGRARIVQVLGDTAAALEHLVGETLALMNEGATLDRILGAVRVPGKLLERPYLQPFYDDPEFVLRNIWRLYGGWYDGNPAHLKPARDAALGAEIAALAGGVRRLAARAAELAEAGELALACHLVEHAAAAAPADAGVHAIRARIYRARRDAEMSLMAQGIFGDAADHSSRVADDPPGPA